VPIVQENKGNINYKKDFDILFSKLSNGWDTTIRDIKNLKI